MSDASAPKSASKGGGWAGAVLLLVVLAAILAVIPGFLMVKRDADTRQELESLGADCLTSPLLSFERPRYPSGTWGSMRLKRREPDDFPLTTHVQMDGLRLAPAVRFEGPFQKLTAFPMLEFLSLRRLAPTEEDWSQVTHFQHLNRLVLAEMTVPDEAIALMAQAPLLVEVEFDSCRLGPQALAHLAQIEKLRSLSLRHSDFPVSDLPLLAGLKHLQQFDLTGIHGVDDLLRPVRAGLPELVITDD